jgi:hypothetical protein
MSTQFSVMSDLTENNTCRLDDAEPDGSVALSVGGHQVDQTTPPRQSNEG